MQNTELRRRARPVLDALRTLALQGRTPVLGLRKKSCPYHSWDTVQEDPATAPGWTPFAPGDAIGGVEAHYCFRGGITARAAPGVTLSAWSPPAQPISGTTTIPSSSPI